MSWTIVKNGNEEQWHTATNSDYNIYTLDIKVVAKKSFIAFDLHFAHFEGRAKLPIQIGCQLNFSGDS